MRNVQLNLKEGGIHLIFALDIFLKLSVIIYYITTDSNIKPLHFYSKITKTYLYIIFVSVKHSNPPLFHLQQSRKYIKSETCLPAVECIFVR